MKDDHNLERGVHDDVTTFVFPRQQMSKEGELSENDGPPDRGENSPENIPEKTKTEKFHQKKTRHFRFDRIMQVSKEEENHPQTQENYRTTHKPSRRPSEWESIDFFTNDVTEGEGKPPLLLQWNVQESKRREENLKEHWGKNRETDSDGNEEITADEEDEEKDNKDKGDGREDIEEQEDGKSRIKETKRPFSGKFKVEKFLVKKEGLPTEIHLPFHVSRKQLHEELAKRLFIPAITISEPLKNHGITTGYGLEDDGLFMGEKPTISRINLNILHDRFQKHEKSDEWFTNDHQVMRSDIPLSDPMTYRPRGDDTDPPVHVFVPACPAEEFSKMEERRIQASAQKGILNFCLGSVQFTTHTLFSQEHHLAADLVAKVETHKERNALRLFATLHEKLKVLRKALQKLKQIDIEHDTAAHSSIPSRVRSELDTCRRRALYRREIRECRFSLHGEGKRDREIESSILSLWKALEVERRKTGFYVTPHHLIITEEQGTKTEDEEREEMKLEIRKEIEERIEEEEEEMKKKMDKYKRDMDKWREDHKERKEASKRQKRRQEKTLQDLDETESVQMAKDQIILKDEEKAKPSPPKEINIKKIKRDVEESFKMSHRPPGDPIYYFDLTSSEAVTSTPSCPTFERQRRGAVGKTKICLRIYINNKLVTETPSVKLNDDFMVPVSSSLVIALVSWPYSVKVEIFEKEYLRQRLIASVSLPLPSKSSTDATHTIMNIANFSSNKMLETSKSKGKSKKMDDLYEGKLTFSLLWKTDKNGRPILPPGSPVKRTDLRLDDVQNPHSFNLEDSLQLDPSDPRNAHWISRAKMDSKGLPKPNVFHLHAEEELFCSAETFEKSVRLRVLRLRHQGVPEFKGFRFVPAVESEMLKRTLENYDRRRRRVSSYALDDGDEEKYEVSERKAQAEALVQAILRKLEEQSAQSKEVASLKDLVKEEQIPNIGSIGKLLSVLKAKRPLKPERKKRPQVRGIGLSDQNVKLIVHITRGFHIPVRREIVNAREGSVSSSSDSLTENWDNIVRPFVEVSFQKQIGKTHAAQGSSPTWNEQLVLPFKPPNNDFTASNLQTIEDHVFFHLYDEVLHDLLDDERKRTTTVHRQIEKRWLGSLKIPFSTIYMNNKIEGTFRLECPTVLLGYTEDETLQGEAKDMDNISSPHLSIYLTLEPTLPSAETIKEPFNSTEPESVTKEGSNFVSWLTSRFPTRHFQSHVPDLLGELVSLNRFIQPLEPPKEVVGGDGSTDFKRVIWFTSLLPCLENTHKHGSIPKLWSNAEQFVSLGIGGIDEKAVLLTNFFLFLNLKAFFLLGRGIPEGICSYVLVKYKSKWQVVCPDSAAIFELNHPFSPLQSIYMLINEENIYANIQDFDDPPRMNFDVKVSSEWKPFYTHSFPSLGLPSVQPRTFVFKPVDGGSWKDIKKRLRVILKDAFMKWRPLHRTPWNEHLTKILHGLIVSYEKLKARGKSVTPNVSDLKTIMDSYKICGVCIHQGYTTVESVVEAVFSTGIHASHIPGIEFALAVDIFPYPGEAASVWVYVASLSRR